MRKVTIEAVPVNRTLHAFPKVVIIEIVAGCNLRCIMCPLPKMTRRTGIMDLDLYKKIIDEIAATDPNTDVWAPIMGELFIYGDRVFDYLGYAKAAGLNNVFINTNLVLFTPEMIPLVRDVRLDKMTIGIDATTEETYNQIRVRGDFQRVEDNIHSLLGAKRSGGLPDTEIVLQFIVQDENAHEEEAFKRRWADSGATLKIRHKLGWGQGVHTAALTIGDNERNVPCPWLMRTMSIHWTGQVAQCDAVWNGDEYVGDLNHMTIEDVWRGELESKRLRHLANDFDFWPCQDCSDWQCGLSEVHT